MSKEYYLYVNGQRVKVSEQIYKVYWREKEHEKYLEQVDKKNHLLFFSSLDHDGHLSIPACFIPSFRREDTANPVDKIPQFREWSTIIPELDTADFLNLYTVFMRLTA